MNTPSVFPLLFQSGDDSVQYDEYGIDLHDLAALVAFGALLARQGVVSPRGPVLKAISDLAWDAADSFLAARRDPKEPTAAKPEGGAA